MLKTKVTVTLRSGLVIPAGSQVTWVDGKGDFNGQKLSALAMVKALGKKIPSEKTLWKYSMDGVSKSVMGKKVEPDGYDSTGSPSWLVALRLI